MNAAALRAALAGLDTELRTIHEQAGDRQLNATEQARWDEVEAERADVAAGLAEAEQREQRDTSVAARRAKWGTTQVQATSAASRAPWSDFSMRGESPTGWVARAQGSLDRTDGLSDRARDMLAEAIDEPGGDAAARFIVTRSNPDYLSAFTKVLGNPERAFHTFTPDESRAFAAVEEARAVIAHGGGTGTGGYLVPLALDPNLAAIVNDGTVNPFRRISSVKTTISSPARAIKSTGITAAWVAEGVAFGDNSPAFTNLDIPLAKLAAYAFATYEVFEDAENLASNLVTLFADARDRAESAAFWSGSGSDAPKGIWTAISGTAGSLVTATTRGTFTSASSVDVLAMLNGLPARARTSGNASGVANYTTLNVIRQMTLGSGATLPMFETPPVLGSASTLHIGGLPILEASSVTATTTSGNALMVLGDFSKYRIVDSVAGPSLEFVPTQFDQATGRPNGTRGWVYYQRTGADCLDVTQFRALKA